MTKEEAAYWVGVVVQVIDEAGPEGITLGELRTKTQLGAEALAEALAVAVARGSVKRLERYYPNE